MEDNISKELMNKLLELANADLDTERFLAKHLHQLDYYRDNEIFKKFYSYLSKLRETSSWNNFWRPLTSPPLTNWKLVLSLGNIVLQEDEVVWFIVELSRLAYHPIFEGRVNLIEKITDECRLLEYYVISKDFRWVVAKSRNDEIFVDGDVIKKH